MAKKQKLVFIKDYDHKNDWYYEGNISRAIVAYLEKNEYKVLNHNSDNIRNRGVDIIAVDTNGVKELIEVKGYPTQYHTKGDKIGHPKVTNPKLQATHWFSEAILCSISNYEKFHNKSKIRLALGFPHEQRYLELLKKVQPFFTDFNLDLKTYFVAEDGTIIIKNLNSNL